MPPKNNIFYFSSSAIGRLQQRLCSRWLLGKHNSHSLIHLLSRLLCRRQQWKKIVEGVSSLREDSAVSNHQLLITYHLAPDSSSTLQLHQRLPGLLPFSLTAPPTIFLLAPELPFIITHRRVASSLTTDSHLLRSEREQGVARSHLETSSLSTKPLVRFLKQRETFPSTSR